MTDPDIDALTAPTDYGTPAPINSGGGLTVSDVDQPRPVVRCGNCGNHPVRGVSNPACDRHIHKRETPYGEA